MAIDYTKPNKCVLCPRPHTARAGPSLLGAINEASFLAFLGFHFELAAPRAAARQQAAARCARAGCRGHVCGRTCGGPTGSWPSAVFSHLPSFCRFLLARYTRRPKQRL